MKIGILTWLHNGNYGSLLQAFALQRFLRDSGYEVENIDLCPSLSEKVLNLLVQGNSCKLFLEKLNLYRIEHASRDKKASAERKMKFESFLKDEFILTRVFKKFSDLKELRGRYDVFVCGSDQIWSPTLFSPSYYFDFLLDSDTKIAYACSFGVSQVCNKKKNRIAKLLSRFHSISVREQEGREIVKELTGRDVKVNLDPTMLMDANQWNLNVPQEPLIQGNYMFCYFLSYNSEQWNRTITLAKDRNIKIVVIPTIKEVYNVSDAVIVENVGPADWVNLIKNASIVCTDSFHGCVFSIIYNRPFVAFKRFLNDSKHSQNSRVYNLLNSFGLESVLVDDNKEYYPMDFNEDTWSMVNKRMKKYSCQSKDWLIQSIQNEK